MSVIAAMIHEAQSLLEALKQRNPEQVEAAYQRFREAVQAAWDRYQDGKIAVSVRGLPRAMYIWAVEELPQELRDPGRWAGVERQLAQFARTVEWVVEPREA